jgi:hypothetical protein
MGTAGHQHSRLPGAPRLDHQILVAIATGRAGDLALDELQRPITFFKTFTQTGCTRNVQFFEYKQSTMEFGEGTRHRLPVLRIRLPRPDDPLAVQPDPVEPAVVEDPRRHALHRLHRAGVPVHFDLKPGTVFKTQKVSGRDPQGSADGTDHLTYMAHAAAARIAAPQWSKEDMFVV